MLVPVRDVPLPSLTSLLTPMGHERTLVSNKSDKYSVGHTKRSSTRCHAEAALGPV